MRLAAFTLLLVGFGSATPSYEQPLLHARPAAEIEELLWWLPADTETVMVTQAPVRPSGPLFEAMPTAAGKLDVDERESGKILTRYLARSRVTATVEGSRRFAPPSGLGGMLFEGASLYLFAKPIASRAGLMAALDRKAVSREQIGKVKVVEFRDEIEDDTWSTFIAVPRSDVLVVGTNREYLAELLDRIPARSSTRALPSDLPEWKWVDVRAPFWALRHYRKDRGGIDPTSPYTKDRTGAAFDEDAIGVAVHVATDGRTVTAHYLSNAARAEAISARLWRRPGEGVSPAIRRSGRDTIEVTLAARDQEHLSTFFFYVVAALGHAVYL
jgi:hypothetical protein